jgi:hypothetical protein
MCVALNFLSAVVATGLLVATLRFVMDPTHA